jgi:predicted phosphodiesterase
VPSLSTLVHYLNTSVFLCWQKKVTVVHGSYFNTSEFIFKSTVWEDIVANFKATDSDVIIAGHCGLPFNKTQDGLLWLNPE